MIPFVRELFAIIDHTLSLDIARHLPHGGILPPEGHPILTYRTVQEFLRPFQIKYTHNPKSCHILLLHGTFSSDPSII